MKRYIKDSTTYIEAMSTINPQLCDNCGIRVEIEERNEGPIPHIHVYHDKTRDPRKCSYVRLDQAAYSDHHAMPSPKMPPRVKREFIKVMTSEWPKAVKVKSDGTVYRATGYEAAVDTWVDCFENGSYDKFNLDDEGNLILIDYSTL